MSAVPYFFTAHEAADVIGGTLAGRNIDAPLPQAFRADSREVSPGSVFIAVRGARADGHDFIADVARAGAGAIIAEAGYVRDHAAELADIPSPIIIAPEGKSSTDAAVMLARKWREKISPIAIGITGSVGKTTTRELLARVLGRKYRVHSAIKSYNTLIGCAMTVLSMPADADLTVLEFGANHPGEIAELVSAFPVELAVITDVAPAHLEGFGTIEDVCRAKMEITSSPRLKFLSYNHDNNLLRSAVTKLPPGVTAKGVGASGGEIRLDGVRQCMDSVTGPNLSLYIEDDGSRLCCRADIYGAHNAMNIGLAYAAAHELGVTGEEFSGALSEYSMPRGRCGVIAVPGGIVIDDSYNSNPRSLASALNNLSSLDLPSGMRRIAVLGGMKELGESSAALHEETLAFAAGYDALYLVGEEWDSVTAPVMCERFADAREFLSGVHLCNLGRAAVLVKGSRAYALESVVAALTGEGGALR